MIRTPHANRQIEQTLEEFRVVEELVEHIERMLRRLPSTEGWPLDLVGRYSQNEEDGGGRLAFADVGWTPKLMRFYDVSYADELIAPGEPGIDVAGQQLTELAVKGNDGVLLFVNLAPAANWAHPCWIATFEPRDGGVLRHRPNDFPPRQQPDSGWRLYHWRRSRQPMTGTDYAAR